MSVPQVVWFKRDLRVRDHEPLQKAMASGPVLPLYVIEPEYWRQSYASGRQWQFLKESLLALDEALTALGQPLWVEIGEAEVVLAQLHQRFRFDTIFSHQETGPQWTFARDLRVKAWCKATGVAWHESRQHGVIRGLSSRRGWAGQWHALMDAPRIPAPAALMGVGLPVRKVVEQCATAPVGEESIAHRQIGGSAAGQAVLDDFLKGRGLNYRQGMSSPLTAATACSRLSTHLALGTLSMREVWQQSEAVRSQYRERDASGRFAASLKSFGSRLHWHCHFMQKLESEPRMEWEPLHQGFIGLREDGPDRLERLERLSQGMIGWPFVDACLRALQHTGWLNFRMRAMLVAVASYHLWLDWVDTAPFFARWFTDFEAGIHYSQMQMQSGTTGINANRIYNPIKQSQDQDPEGVFIRRWVPELSRVEAPWIHQPWKMPKSMQEGVGCVIGRDYPTPVGDPVQMAREARARLSHWISTHDLKPEAQRVLATHGSRLQQKRPRYGKKSAVGQFQLEF